MDKRESRGRQAECVSAIAVAVNLMLFAAKWTAGRHTGSMSVVADAYNNLSDAGTAAVGLLGFALAGRPADREHPYGHARYEYLAALIVSAGQLTVAIGLIYDSVLRIVRPRPVEWAGGVTLLLAVSVSVKLLLAALDLVAGRRLASGTLKAAALDSLSDAGATSAVLLGGYCMRRFGLQLDGWLGLAIGLLILAGAVSLCRETISSLLGRIPSKEETDAIRDCILAGRGVLGVHDLQVHDYGPGHRFASAHVELPAALTSLESHEVLDGIEDQVQEQTGISLVLHCDPVLTEDENLPAVRSALEETAAEMDSRITLHDIRIVPGNGADQVRFDCVIPYGMKLSGQQAQERFNRGVRQRTGRDYRCLPLVEHSFTGDA
ncbi:MAG: cation transporter [Clostridia bacterium]|nr:cation transporter [Clostridia bacterium]